ncbi:lipoprotein HlpB [Muribacter muris]|uniref:Lipoprotein HlpB n=1 Tax=Muribacter muris TaxID=67855 RepID=A0A4Y9K665_9PAST|nr:lipoprotein HlpB [Muribacter muris]MBF0784273.1 lipoprotein HlpB [Muribacter muris]MBF0826989.1 lipoprotein HlpB [Muribacter muris]TFV13012.1 lipoprotein HlpB [Muribacter muris]
MKKLTKISAAALFALFLTACDKPANKAAEAPKAEATPATQPATEAPKAETAVAEQAAKTVDTQGAEEYKKLLDWNASLEKEIAAANNELQQKFSSGDKAQIEAGYKAFTAKVDDVLKSLDALEFKNESIIAFKEKMKSNQTEEAKKAFQAKTEALMQGGVELQKLQSELEQKFAH